MHPDLVVLLLSLVAAAAGVVALRRRSLSRLVARPEAAALAEENERLRAELDSAQERLDFADRLLGHPRMRT